MPRRRCRHLSALSQQWCNCIPKGSCFLVSLVLSPLRQSIIFVPSINWSRLQFSDKFFFKESIHLPYPLSKGEPSRAQRTQCLQRGPPQGFGGQTKHIWVSLTFDDKWWNFAEKSMGAGSTQVQVLVVRKKKKWETINKQIMWYISHDQFLHGLLNNSQRYF